MNCAKCRFFEAVKSMDLFGDLIGFSGENKTRTVLRAALAAVRKEIEG